MSRKIKHMGNVGVVRLAFMALFQCFVCPVSRKPTVVENHDFVGINANLYGYLAGIVFVHNGVEHSFTQSIFGKRITLYTVDAIVGNQSFLYPLLSLCENYVAKIRFFCQKNKFVSRCSDYPIVGLSDCQIVGFWGGSPNGRNHVGNRLYRRFISSSSCFLFLVLNHRPYTSLTLLAVVKALICSCFSHASSWLNSSLPSSTSSSMLFSPL